MRAYTNRLAGEQSPYLLQHAGNPVDWYPWCDEAFEKAKREDKPVFLSIGYATCHWCHVMEHESFDNKDIAELLNKAFVCVKVDREERPDIDSIYMTVCQVMTGSGGWPLTLLMTAEKNPFYAATYIPPESRFGRIGMRQLIPRVVEMWKTRRSELLESASQITQMLTAHNTQSEPGRLGRDILDRGYAALMTEYDGQNGGFGSRPKFPTPHKLIFLLRSGSADAVRAVEHTLEEMRKGGIFDQIGFGFHRYSTDDEWLLPHFEKMLYDQALHVMAYTEAFERTGRRLYRSVAEEIFTYVLRDMHSAEGGFFSAEDADSEGEEGLFYVWEAEVMQSVLGADYDVAARVWNISPSGNFRDEATGQMTGKNIPHLKNFPSGYDLKRLSEIRQRLFDLREQRIHPLKDTKILTDWNGLMIAALAKAGRAFNRPDYIQAAITANDFIACNMRTDDGRLWHRYRDGNRAVSGQLDDYAFMIFGLLELYAATYDADCLEAALHYNSILGASFADAAGGGYFMTSEEAEELIVRPKSFYDGAVPSGNSMQMYNLLRLARLTGRFELEQKAGDVGQALGASLQRAPTGFSQALIALQTASTKAVQVVVVGARESDETKEILDYLRGACKPGMAVLFKDPKEGARLAGMAPFTSKMEMQNGKTTVYICRNFACDQPITSLEEIRKRLR